MRKKLFVTAALAVAAGFALMGIAQSDAAACGPKDDTVARSFGKMSVEEVWSKMEAKAPIHIFDNNSKERFEEGHVPGATWLDFRNVTASVLPADKDATLVFYCAREQCTACHKGADAALRLGYVNVYIMPEGIMGWEAKGKPVERPETAAAPARQS